MLQTDNRAKRGMNVTERKLTLITVLDCYGDNFFPIGFRVEESRKVTKQKIADSSIVQLNVLLTRF